MEVVKTGDFGEYAYSAYAIVNGSKVVAFGETPAEALARCFRKAY